MSSGGDLIYDCPGGGQPLRWRSLLGSPTFPLLPLCCSTEAAGTPEGLDLSCLATGLRPLGLPLSPLSLPVLWRSQRPLFFFASSPAWGLTRQAMGRVLVSRVCANMTVHHRYFVVSLGTPKTRGGRQGRAYCFTGVPLAEGVGR